MNDPQKIANRYVVESLIGQGGMADVYKARDEILNRVVAIKVLRSKLADDPLVLVRFTREASAASKLSHPNVVDIYDVGEGNGLHYIVMEYVKGVTLKQMISRRGALDVYEAMSIMRQLVSGVAAAHASQIIHRDIKPQNIMVKADGTVKITDFGIAVATGSVALTHNNAVMGSAHYLAPESARGKAPDVRVDIYSLGIVFYELLTNQVPFAGTTPAEIAFKHMQDEMPRVRDFNPTIPQSIENIIIKATAKDPNERYTSADAMLMDLDKALDPESMYEKPLVLKTTTLSASARNEAAGIRSKNNQRTRNGSRDEVIRKKNRTSGRSDSRKKERESSGRLSQEIHGGMSATTILVSLLFVVVVIAGSFWTGLIRIPGFLGYEVMPSVITLSKKEAIRTMENAGFYNITTIEDLSETIPAGSVAASSANSGDVVKTSDEIQLTISKGPSYLVPDFTGLSLVQVQSRLASSHVNLDLDIEYEGAANTNPGIVLKQELLEPGTRIDPNGNETMRLVVSSYPSIELDESLIGMDVQEAKNQLNAQGIAVVLSNSYGGDTVVSVDPPIGSTYTQEGTDSVVTLYH